MNIKYLLPRLARRHMPYSIVKLLLENEIIIRPGMETKEPQDAFTGLVGALECRKFEIAGKKVMVFGYGGNYGLGCHILHGGADAVYLCDRFAKPRPKRNALFVEKFPDILKFENGDVAIISKNLVTLHDDISALPENYNSYFDIIQSQAVLEHVKDVETIVANFKEKSNTNSINIHWVDLRDHFFKFPFEMLTFSENVWKNYLNPNTHHNSLRMRDFSAIFCRHFRKVEITPVARDLEEFAKAKSRLKPQFLTGNDDEDCVTEIKIVASEPIQ